MATFEVATFISLLNLYASVIFLVIMSGTISKLLSDEPIISLLKWKLYLSSHVNLFLSSRPISFSCISIESSSSSYKENGLESCRRFMATCHRLLNKGLSRIEPFWPQIQDKTGWNEPRLTTFRLFSIVGYRTRDAVGSLKRIILFSTMYFELDLDSLFQSLLYLGWPSNFFY